MKFYLFISLFFLGCFCSSNVSAIENHDNIQSGEVRILKIGVIRQFQEKKNNVTNDDELLTSVGVLKEKTTEVACIFDQNEFKKIPQLFARHQDFNIPPGIQFLDETVIDNILVYEDLYNVEINFDNNDDNDDGDNDTAENEYSFVSTNQFSKQDHLGILAYNDEKNSDSSNNNSYEIIETNPINKVDSTPSVLVTIQKLVEGKKLVTNTQYNKFLESSGEPKIYAATENKDEHPVIDISLEEAKKYAKWRNKTLVIQQNKSHGIGVGLLSETQDKIEWIPIPLPNQWN